LIGGQIFTAPDGPPIDNGTVVIESGIITDVGLSARVPVRPDLEVISCERLIVLAGFQNSHVHFTEDKWADAARQPPLQLEAHLREMLTRYGFTTVVDTASHLGNTNDLRQRIETGEVAGPRILTSGLALYPPDGIPFYVRDAVPPELLRDLPQPSTAAEAVECVNANLDQGADIVKLFTGSWISPREVALMPLSIATAAVTKAHGQNKLVFVHPSNVRGLEIALEARADVLAHAIDSVYGLTHEHIDRMLTQDVTLVPTLKLLAADGRREVLDQVRDYARSGGQILFGTDVGFMSDYDPLREYELMEAAGMTWRQILASLTTEPARRFNEGARRGRLAPGMEGDVVVIGSDPLRGSRAFANVRYTIRAGRLIYEHKTT
jgi:imidazolonepropionase-like amidohydrolase